jgi:hypothetical protein
MNPFRKLLPSILAWPAAFLLLGACAPSAAGPEAEEKPAPQTETEPMDELYGETPESLLKLSFADWEKKVADNKGDIMPADYERAIAFWVQAAAAHHAEKAQSLGDPKGSSILLAVSLMDSAADALRDAELAAAPEQDSAKVDALFGKAQAQGLVHLLLQKDNDLPEGMLSGNLFGEIESNWIDEINALAKLNKTEDSLGSTVDAAIAAVRAARSGEYEGLSEAEVNAIRQLLAHWMAPGSFDPPVKIEEQDAFNG